MEDIKKTFEKVVDTGKDLAEDIKLKENFEKAKELDDYIKMMVKAILAVLHPLCQPPLEILDCGWLPMTTMVMATWIFL